VEKLGLGFKRLEKSAKKVSYNANNGRVQVVFSFVRASLVFGNSCSSSDIFGQ